MTLIEAMSQGLPVVAGAHAGAVPWVLGHGRAGVLVDVDDPRAIARAVEAVLSQEALRERLVNDGYDWAWKKLRRYTRTLA
jgi:glycosyltransferase involved in cell wall biosynthesis